MNSDKMDHYFREQINSLDRTPVPGVEWSPEKSWGKVKNPENKKRFWLWWTTGSIAAAVALLIAFWPASQTFETQNQLVTATEINSGEGVGIDGHDKTSEPASEVFEAAPPESQIPELQTAALQNQTKPDLEPKARIKPVLNFIEPVYTKQLSEVNPAQMSSPELIVTKIQNANIQNNQLALNRVYIIKNSQQQKNIATASGQDVKLRIDLTMKSTNDPPGGILANFRR